MQVTIHIGLLFFFLSITLLMFFRSRTASIENKAKELRVNKIITVAKQWIQSSTYDSDPVVALMHASGGMAYLSCARILMNDTEISLATTQSIKSLSDKTQANMSSAIKKIRTQRTERRY